VQALSFGVRAGNGFVVLVNLRWEVRDGGLDLWRVPRSQPRRAGTSWYVLGTTIGRSTLAPWNAICRTGCALCGSGVYFAADSRHCIHVDANALPVSGAPETPDVRHRLVLLATQAHLARSRSSAARDPLRLLLQHSESPTCGPGSACQ